MKREFLLLYIILLFLQAGVPAADDKVKIDSTKTPGWHPQALVGFNISQIALKDWSQGGDNSLTWVGTFSGSLNYFSLGGLEFKNSLRLAYGRTKLGSQNFRQNNNELYQESVLSQHIGWAVDPFFSNNIRTSLTTGYQYTQNTQTAISGFWDPSYVTQSLGFTYEKNKVFITRLGIATQETFANKYRQYTNKDTSVSKEKTFKFDTGMESVTNCELALAENIKLQSSLRLFTRFESLDVWDVRWDNLIIGKINSFLNMNFSYTLIYQKDQSPFTQMREGLNVGFTYAIF